MAGIIFINEKIENDSWHLLQHEPWLSFETHSLDNCYLGRISNGIFNLGQPAYDDRFQVYIDGEFSNRDELWSDLNSTNSKLPQSDHWLILELLRQGRSLEAILKNADGGVFITVVDCHRQVIHFGNDRFGLRPHYFCHKGSRFVLAPEMKFCIARPWVSDQLDMLSVAEYFNFQVIFADRTFFSDINLFPSASVSTFDLANGSFTAHKYWQPEDWSGELFKGSFEDAAEETTMLFRKIVADMTSDKRRYGIYLSGGLDSRQVLAAVPDNIRPLHTFTFGPDGCRDQVYAAQMASIAKTNHEKIYFNNGKWLQGLAEKHTILTECFHCLWHAHNFKDANTIRKHIDINLSGHFGDVIIGGSVLKDCSFEYEFRNRLRGTYVSHYGFSFSKRGEFHDAWALNYPTEEQLFSSLFQYRDCHKGLTPSVASDFMAIEFRARKMIQYYLVHNRPYFEARLPFMNSRLLKVVYSFPPEYRKNRRLQIAILDLLNKKLSAVPWDNTNNLPTQDKRLLFQRRIILRADRVLHKFTGRNIFTPSVESYNDYSKWIVDDLQEWIYNVLLESDALVPRFFKDGYVKSILQNYFEGGDRNKSSTYKIGTMLSLELMLQQMKTIK